MSCHVNKLLKHVAQYSNWFSTQTAINTYSSWISNVISERDDVRPIVTKIPSKSVTGKNFAIRLFTYSILANIAVNLLMTL